MKKYIYIKSGNKLKENTKVVFYVLLLQLITKHQYGWRSCKVNNIDKSFGVEGLKDGYEKLIEPFLETIFENNR